MLIIEKAQEIGELLEENEIAIRYHESSERMEKDPDARELHARLVELGKELDRKIKEGEPFDNEESLVHEMLEERLEQNLLVKEYIGNEKAYLALMTLIIQKIRDPHGDHSSE